MKQNIGEKTQAAEEIVEENNSKPQTLMTSVSFGYGLTKNNK